MYIYMYYIYIYICIYIYIIYIYIIYIIYILYILYILYIYIIDILYTGFSWGSSSIALGRVKSSNVCDFNHEKRLKPGRVRLCMAKKVGIQWRSS